MKTSKKITLFLALITALSFFMHFGGLAFCPWDGGHGPP